MESAEERAHELVQGLGDEWELVLVVQLEGEWD
jgi:hypothetical protein